jgi:hypothetical protein
VTYTWLPFVGRPVTVVVKLLVVFNAMSCAPAVLPTHSWYEVAPDSCDQVNVTVVPVSLDPFAGEVICAVTGVTVKVPLAKVNV